VPARAVVGRAAELAAVDEFLEALADGPSVLVLEGEPGIGKTTLWQAAVERARARGVRVLASRPGFAETRLTFAGLGDLLSDVEDDTLVRLPLPQRRALEIALLRADAEGTAPDRRIVSAAFLGAVRVLAEDVAVLVAIDDYQWLDTASRHVVEFAQRRLEAEQVGTLVAVRLEGSAPRVFADAGARRSRLGALNVASLHEILKQELDRTFARPTLVRIEAASSGNPFFAIELARTLDERAEPLQGSAPLPIPGDLTELLVRRVRRLPRAARRTLLAASALSTPTLDLLDPDDVARAEAADLVRVDERQRVQFLHPLLAASVYASATARDRRAVHAEIAERVPNAEERARHLALAADGPDGQVASALADAAQAARDRGAPDAAIELLELACDLTPAEERDVLFERRLDLGRYLSEAGDPTRALEILRGVAADTPNGAVRARSLLLLAYMTETTDAGETANDLCEQALLAASDSALQVEILAAASRMSDYDVERKLAYAQRALDLAEKEPVGPQLRSYALLASAEARFYAGDGIVRDVFARAAELENEAAADERALPGRSLHRMHHYSDVRPSERLLGILRIYADELDEARAEFEREREIATDHGDEVQLARTLIRLSLIELRAGNVNRCSDHLDEAAAVLERTQLEALVRWMLATRASLETVRGRTEEARMAAMEASTLSEAAGSAWGVAECHAALGFLELSLGSAEAAVEHLGLAAEIAEQIGPLEPRLLRGQADYVEALVAMGELDRAGLELARIERSRSPWAGATGGRCRALLSSALGDLAGASDALEDAFAAHARLPLPFELARTQLVAGQVHRRRNERRLAREALDRSIALFEELGAPLWADRAAAERERLGLRRGSDEELTPTEEQVASLAASGLTNRRIAEQMFISPKTVEANLSRAYRKLGIHSRAELGARMSDRERSPSA
jgi:DNA-binding CsgD family transcriptional regulator